MLMNAPLTRRRLLAAGSALAATTLLAACGAADEDPDDGNGTGADPTASPTTPPPATPPSATPGPDPQGTTVPNPISYPTGADELVLQIYYTGGFVPQEYNLTQLPLVSLYGDGRIIVEGPQIDIYPPPALPNLLETRLIAESIQTILFRAEETGLLAGDRVYDDLTTFVADIPYTNIYINAGGSESLVSVYALGLDEGYDHVPAELQETYRALDSFVEFAQSAATNLPGHPQEPYQFEQLRIYSMPVNKEVSGTSEVAPEEVVWPLSTLLSELGAPSTLEGISCFVIEGADLQALLPYLEEANTETRWESDEQLYMLFLRPLLPHEHGCPTSEIPAPGPAGFEHPSAPDELVLRIETQPGFGPLESLATNEPVVSLMGDGSLIGQGPVPFIYPGPALPNLTYVVLNEDGIQAILTEAEAAGLMDGDRHYDAPGVADAGTVVFTVNANGQTNVVSVYAPGSDDDSVEMAEGEREARRKLRDFMNLMIGTANPMSDMPDWLPAGAIISPVQQLEFQRMQITAQPEANAPQPDDVIEPVEAQWPLATPLGQLGDPYFLEMSRCFVVEGEDLATLLPALEQASHLTPWVSNGEQYRLYLRPLMPDETGCTDPFA